MSAKLRRTLTTLPLIFVLYFNVSGGPFTTEGLVASIGPGIALLILILIPIFWALPEALIIGELASMLPEEGGYYRWVKRAFGPFWAFQNGWLTWLYSLVDMAIYPVLFNAYLAYFFPGLSTGVRWIISLAMIWSATAINLRGAFNVGRVSVILGLYIMLGFLLTALAALPHITHVPWQPFATASGATTGTLGIGLSIALWNYIGWDNASTVQGEVVDASRSYPRALGFALPLVTLGYLIPLLATLGATDWTTWSEGSWPHIALAATGRMGPFLAFWLATAGLVSALGLFNALLLAYSRIPLAMADDGMLPAFLAKTDRRGTPTNAVLVSAVCYSVFALLPFAGLVTADVLLYAGALFLEFGALIALRKREPGLRGAFRIPLGRTGVIVLAVIPVLVLVLVIGLELQQREFGLPAVVGALAGAAVGPLVYRLMTHTVQGYDAK
jgi:amino acid transporter